MLLRDKKTYFSFKYEINKKKKIVIFITLALLTSLLHIVLLNINYPMIGHDISLIRPRAMSMLLFAQKNGLSIEWASPLVGGGLLQYANPQYHQYSPLYFLTLIMPFWTAYNVLTFLFAIVGFVSMFFILKDIFNLDYKLNITGAVLFACTGYYIYHLQVGHWTFITHPLTAFMVWVFFSDRFSSILKILLGSLSFSIMLFSGSVQTIFFYTCFALLGVAALLFKKDLKFINSCLSIIISVMLGFVLSISKMYPAFMLAARIDRGSPILHDVPIYQFFYFLYYYLLLSPLSFIEHLLSISLYQNINYSRGLWERDIGFPFLIFFLTIVLLVSFRKSFKSFLNSLWKDKKPNVIFFILWVYMFVDMYYDKGLTHSLFPMFNNTNMHTRMASVLILPVIMIFMFLINKFLLAKKNRELFFITINVITILFFMFRFSYVFIMGKDAFGNYSISNDKTVWNNIKKNYNKYYVDNISNEPEVNILNQFTNDNYNLSSSGLPYEPIYGYFLQTFKPKEEGSAKKIVDARFNFTHPNSLLFFDDNYKQFSGFALDEEADLNKFLHFEKVDWKLERKFEIANMLSLYSHITVFVILIFYSIYSLLLKRKKV